jgi:hypothetical protein
MHKVAVSAEAYVEPDEAYNAAQALEKAINEWKEKWSIAPRQAHSEVVVIQENF